MVQYSRSASRPTPQRMAGSLYVVSTPIGNLDDMTVRALNTLKSVGLVAAEDTRRTGLLLRHFGINTPTTSLHEHNETEKLPALLRKLSDGVDIALVSDAGTPLVCDPGPAADFRSDSTGHQRHPDSREQAPCSRRWPPPVTRRMSSSLLASPHLGLKTENNGSSGFSRPQGNCFLRDPSSHHQDVVRHSRYIG